MSRAAAKLGRRRALLWAVVAGALIAGAVPMSGVASGAAGPPPPSFGRSVDIGLISGVVVVAPPKGQEFRLGVVDRSIPVGSVLDTTHGAVDLRTARPPGSLVKGLQDGQFSGGRFTVLQPRVANGLSEIDLTRPRVPGSVCALSVKGPRSSPRVLAMLRARAHGAFRTRGRYSAATVRGTAWDTIERCDGTLTRVHRGVVAVRDFVRHVTVAVSAGHSYLALAPAPSPGAAARP